MSNSMIPFEFEGNDVRVVEIDGDPWFVASDVSVILGYAQTNNMNKLIDSDDKSKRVLQNGGNYQNQSLINESGVYSAIFGSKNPEAKKFKKWVTSEVLPSIRKHGGYIVGQNEMSNDELLARAVLHAQSVIDEKNLIIQQHEKTITENAPKVGFYEVVTQSDREYDMATVAKNIGISKMGRNSLFSYLRNKDVIRPSSTEPYQRFVNQGYFKIVTVSSAGGMVFPKTVVTQKGVDFIIKLLRLDGMV